MIVSWDIFACITNAFLDVNLMKIVVAVKHVLITNAKTLAIKILVDHMQSVQFRINELVAHVLKEWSQAPLLKLDVFDHRHCHVMKTGTAQKVQLASMISVALFVPVMMDAYIMNAAIEAHANLCAEKMMIVVMEKYVKNSFVPSDVVPIQDVPIIYHALISNAWTLVKIQQFVERTLNVQLQVIRHSAIVQILWLVMQRQVANILQLHASQITIVKKDKHAMERNVKQRVETTNHVCRMNVAFVECAELFATPILNVAKDLFAKIEYAKLDVEQITLVHRIKLA